MPHMPSILPPVENMAYYSTRQMPTTDVYYGRMNTTAPPMPTSLAPSYEPYAVAPLMMHPPAHPVGGHHSHHSSISSTYRHLTPDPQTRVPQSLPTQHRASSGAWTATDDQTLLGARALGQNWSQIQQNYFLAKTPNACRKRHERLMERKGVDDWDNRKMETIAQEYMKLRKEIWAPLAQRTGEKWNVVEQKCMSNGLKNLQGHARAGARRERIEQGLPPTDPYDDSGISMEGLTPGEDMDAEDPWGSPDRRSTSVGAHSYTNGAGGGHHSYTLQPVQHQHQQQYPSHTHSYSSSVSSSMAGYGHDQQQAHSQSSSPYMEPVLRMPSVDMGIDSIINRPGQQN